MICYQEYKHRSCLLTVNEVIHAIKRTAELSVFVLALRTVGDPVAAVRRVWQTVVVVGGAARVESAGVTANLGGGAGCEMVSSVVG